MKEKVATYILKPEYFVWLRTRIYQTVKVDISSFINASGGN